MMFLDALKGLSESEIERNWQTSISTVSRSLQETAEAILAVEHWFITPPGSRYLAQRISDNPKFAGYFDQCIGVIDGTHLPAHIPADLVGQFRGRKGVTQNVLLPVILT